MPDSYTKFPRPESIDFFEKAMRNHNKVRNIKKLSTSYYEIHRRDLSTIRVFVSNYYALSLSDYYDVLEDYDDIDLIIVYKIANYVALKKLKSIITKTLNDEFGLPVHYTTLSQNEYAEMEQLHIEKQQIIFDSNNKSIV
ncbi:MAG: hypothetical protein ACK5L6_06400 [Anaerorhabdus sp.]|uniref:hypothetical protein n=1 Tax=Anaerorhabdus sp. TaxID=1872524 RepID=UPI003A8A934B